MVSFYCVVQYVPDPIANERLNVGIIAYDQDVVTSKFIDDWRRVRAFGEGDIAFLRDFVRDIQAASSPEGISGRVLGPRHVTGAMIEEIAQTWTQCIQLTTPSVSTLPVGELIEDMAPLFLRRIEPKPAPAWRNRAQAVALVTGEVESALLEIVGPTTAKEVLKVGKEIPGKVGRHRFDFQLRNGQLLMAGQALSFEVPESERLRKDVHAAAWAFEDLANRDPDVPRTAVLLPPRTAMDTFVEANETFRALGVEVVTSDDLARWSHVTAERAAQHLVEH